MPLFRSQLGAPIENACERRLLRAIFVEHCSILTVNNFTYALEGLIGIIKIPATSQWLVGAASTSESSLADGVAALALRDVLLAHVSA